MDGHPNGTTFEGEVTIVTGAASGIGRAVCLALAAEGAAVVAADVDRLGIERTIAEMIDDVGQAPRERPLGIVCDVRREEEVDRMIQRTLAEHDGRIDALVACAGILRPGGTPPKPLVDTTGDEWDAVVQTNLRGVFLCNRAVLPAMIAQRRGHIVNLSSTSGRRGRALDAPYCASKFGVIGLSEALAEEVRPWGVKVHVVLPDAVDTPMWEQNGPVPAPADALPPSRIADFILYLMRMPDDTILVSPTIAPFRTRRRAPKPAVSELARSATES
jgi:3-oxoacyl-[acyl-carrier protein] reductase